MAIVKTSRIEINTGTYTAVEIPADVDKFIAFALTTEDGSDFYVSETGSDSDRTRWGGVFARSYPTKQNYGSGSVEVCQVKGSSATYLGLTFV